MAELASVFNRIAKLVRLIPALRDTNFKENGRYFIFGRTVSPPAKNYVPKNKLKVV